MKPVILLMSLALGLFALIQSIEAKAEPSKDKKIKNAMSAAPKAVSKDATILEWPEKEGAEPTVIRKGTNDWSCFPDWPVSPGLDPQCYDKPAIEWITAYMKKQDPKLAQPGIGYMLQGGSEPSNTEPFAMKPAAGEKWLKTPPHIMMFPAEKLDAKLYGTDPHSGHPWIMFPDTPYQHLMIPVK